MLWNFNSKLSDTQRTVFRKFQKGNIKFENCLQGDASENFVLKLSYSI